jgi:asparagine synthetase B (glutamine-hydrolysing)
LSKICGIVSFKKSCDIGPALRRMYEASWQPHYLQKELWQDTAAGLGHFSLGIFGHERQPFFNELRNEAVLFCGKLFDDGRLDARLKNSGSTAAGGGNEGVLVKNLLDHFGPGGLKDINGLFSFAKWNASSRRLHLAGDRYGFRPLYYYHDASRRLFAFSSDLRGILATGFPPLRVNWLAVNSFLRFGHLMGDETLFEDIFRLPAASVLRFENNEIHLSSYWSLEDIPIAGDMTVDKSVEGCIDLFRQAIGRRLNTSPVKHIVLLSGGQDSRHIAAELKRQGVEFTSYTTSGFKPSIQDKVLAKRAAEALGLENVYFPLPKKDFLTGYWARAHALIDYEADLHEWVLPLVDALPGPSYVNFDGIVGDTCLSSVYLNAEDYALARKGKIDELTRKRVDRELLPPIFHPSISKHLDRRLLYETVRAQYQRFAGHPNILNFSVMSSRTRRGIALFAFKMVSEKAESFFPFADNDYFEFAMSIPPELKLDGQMHLRVLHRAYPELRRVPTTKEVDKSTYLFDEIDYLRQKRKYLLRGLVRMLRGRLWAFNRHTAIPRLLRDCAMASLGRDSRFFLCNPANVVLAEWFDRYFPDGVD